MKTSSWLVRVLGAFVAVSIIQSVAGLLATVVIPVKASEPAMPGNMMPWMLLANALTVAALAVLAARSEWRGWALGTVVALIPAAIVAINGIEGIVFLKNSPIIWPRIFLMTGITTLLSIPVWMLLFGRRPDDSQPHFHPIASKSRAERGWKFVVSDVAYLFLYMTAGTIIFPYIKDFYATQTIPPVGNLFALQLLLRGPALVVLCLLFVRMLGMPRGRGALVLGMVFTLLTGVAPLLTPNPYFPDAVRLTHLCEVASSNFVFGVLVGWLWGRPQPARVQLMQQAA
jgi:hypothetical protein